MGAEANGSLFLHMAIDFFPLQLIFPLFFTNMPWISQ